MASHGLSGAADIDADGKLHRFTVDGDKRGSDAGWYILHLDGIPAGAFGSWKTGQRETWTAKIDRKLTGKERESLEEKVKIQRKEREIEQKRVRDEAAARAEQIWNKSSPATTHSYLDKKSIKPHGTRIHDGALVIPLRNDDGKITSLQFITENEKTYLTGGEKRGSYFSISKQKPDLDTPILICEGFATGASLRQATDLPVVVAFDTSNLEAVGHVIRKKFPKNKIVFCADNDQWTLKPIENPGLHYAMNASDQIKAYVAVPVFSRLESKPTDFNDLAQLEGLGRVAEIVEEALEPVSIVLSEALGVNQKPDNPSLTAIRGKFEFIHIIHDWPFTKGKDMKPITNIENVDHLLKANNIKVNYDIIRKDMRIVVPNESYLVDTEKNDKLSRIISIGVTAGLTDKASIQDFIGHIASQHPVNPVAEWIESKPWDGVSRLESFLNTVKAVGDDDPVKLKLKNTLILKWMVSAIAAAYRPAGVSAHGVLVFTGDQYVGKTNWFKSLVPQDLRLTKDGMMLDPKDKDSVYQVVSNWIVELGEIDATFRKADIAQLKAFITKDEDTLRLPYARNPSNFARRTVFFASVNDRDYLSDPTGNRRFWTIEVEDLNHKHGLDMQQIWYEILQRFRAGESYYLDTQEMIELNDHNREYEVTNPIEELIRAKYDWESFNSLVKNERRIQATEIGEELGLKTITIREVKLIHKALKDIANIKPKKIKGTRLFEMPRLKFYP